MHPTRKGVEVNQAIKQKWVKALVSGKYRQGRLYLYDRNTYCCLGVLGAVCGISNDAMDNAMMPDAVASRRYPKLNDDIAQDLAILNDSGVPFDMIAGLIDSAL